MLLNIDCLDSVENRLPAGTHNDVRITNVNYNDEYKSLYIKFENADGNYVFKQKWDFDFNDKKKFQFRIETLSHIFDTAFHEGFAKDTIREKKELAFIALHINSELDKSKKVSIKLSNNVFNGNEYVSFNVIAKPFVFINTTKVNG